MSRSIAKDTATIPVGDKPPAVAKPRTYVCFGSPRGGTSAIAGVMRKLGVFMGSDLPNNHEDTDFVARPNQHRIKTIEARNQIHDVWGWKDPNAGNYIYDLRSHIRNLHLVIVFRDPIATAKGHMRWHKRDSFFAIGDIMTQQQRNIMLSMSLGAPSLLVSYEKAVLHPRNFLNEIGEFLGRTDVADEIADWVEGFLGPGTYKGL